ncbi:hypothetical protein TRFO_21896 [Tritrichomonas foetus]|uniref:Uncharacterized protein n=1 Tax=Tritrichomonas foetus TaxID=1144522 RepID=A0A1J4KE24_9EUKA|nr:hypothetical protein TRFO_21896 [Tritrichomonas foetus]|eukprot:OHT09250.1 hypothetical protein TRFO_21896 [Tritrichomonas foetus]
MLSQDEIELLKKRIEERIETQKQFQKKIERAEKDNEALALMEQMLPNALQEKKEEEQQLLKELRELEHMKSTYINIGDPEGEKNNEMLTKKLSTLEDLLADHIEQLEVNQDLFDNLEFQLEKVEDKENEVTEKLNVLKEQEKKFNKFRMRIPKIAPIMLFINDLEDQIKNEEQHVKKAKEMIQFDLNLIQKFSDENSLCQSQFSRKQADLDAINDDIRINEYQRERLKTELLNLQTEFEHINIERSSVETQFQVQLNSYKNEDGHLSLNILKSKLDSLNTVIKNFPEDSKIELNNQKILITKKKQLAQQIQKKIDSVLYEISHRQNQSTEVMELSKTLENQWKEHEILENTTNKKEDKLYGLQDFLEKRKYVAEEIKKLSLKMKERSGIRNLEQLYEIAFNENRRLDSINRRLTRDLEIYEAEHKQYERELAELH